MGGSGSGTPRAALLKLDGTQLDFQGNISESDFFKFLDTPAEQFRNLEKTMTPTQALKFRNHIVRMRVGTSAAIPMLCFLPDELVTMGDWSQKKIQDIEVGDIILTSSGLKKEVTKTFCRDYNGEVIRFGTSKYSNYRSGWSTLGHEYAVRKVSFSKAKPGVSLGKEIECKAYREVTTSFEWIKACDIQKGDYLETPIVRPSIYTMHSLIPKEESKATALSIVLGYYLAEGSLRIDYRDNKGHLSGDHIQFTFHIKEKEYIEELKSSLLCLGYNGKEYLYPDSNSRVLRVHDKGFSKYIEKLCGKHSNSKIINNEIFAWPKSLKENILRCYINGDGCYKKDGSCEVKTVSLNLSWQLYYLSLSIGLAPSFPVKDKQDYYNTYYSSQDISVLLKKENKLSFSTSKVFGRSTLFHKVKIIEKKEYIGPVYNFEVKDCHSYVLNGFSVHNCGAKKCPIKQCPFHDGGGYPVAEPCPIEGNLIATWTRSYIEDLGVNVESRTEMILVNKLVECDIVDYRANIGLSTDEEAWSLLKIDISSNGEIENETTNAHPLLEVKERVHRDRLKVLESLAATRKEKYKRAAALKKREGENIGNHFADLKKALGVASSRAKGVSIKQLKEDAESLAEKNKEESIEDADWTIEGL